jgi:predicted nucleotidyltransferase
VAVVAFGSFARGEADADSDLDFLLVRPDAVDAEDASWEAQRHRLEREVERWTGNRCQVVELSRADLAQAVDADDGLAGGLRHDGRSLAGPPVGELLAPSPVR